MVMMPSDVRLVRRGGLPGLEEGYPWTAVRLPASALVCPREDGRCLPRTDDQGRGVSQGVPYRSAAHRPIPYHLAGQCEGLLFTPQDAVTSLVLLRRLVVSHQLFSPQEVVALRPQRDELGRARALKVWMNDSTKLALFSLVST